MKLFRPRTITIAFFAVLFGTGAVRAAADARDFKAWYGRAHEDLEIARLLHEESAYDGAVCFHAHQAVEKILKGVFYLHGKTPERTHFTETLADGLTRYEPRLKAHRRALRELDAIYVPSRYPKQGVPSLNGEDASACLARAEPVFDLLRGRLSGNR